MCSPCRNRLIETAPVRRISWHHEGVGLWIEDGEIAFPVDEITIAGHFGEMLQGIDRVGSELNWHSRVAAPPLRVANMTE